MPKVVLALCWCEGVEQVSDPSPRGFNGTLIGLSEEGLELGDYEGMNATGSSECPIVFDGVQVWAVGVGGARKRPGGAFSPNNGTADGLRRFGSSVGRAGLCGCRGYQR